MKKCLVSPLALGLSLVALPFLGGCTQQNAGGSNPFVSSASAEVVVAEQSPAADAVTNAPTATDTNLVIAAAETNALATTQTNMPAELPATELSPPTEQKPPADLHLSPVLSEAVKLVQSGVDQTVLYNFITNTTGYFMLGADEIVYLNDLGVEGNIITAMMEHDKALRELRASTWEAAQVAASNQATQQVAEPEPEVATAPSYIEAPPLEAEPVYVSNNYFYDTLSPYGNWVYVPGYGRCWRPTVAISNPGWRPYVDRGRWVYSDSGWYWLSDYSWGATAFHYGRWFNDSRWGWCWWPDTVWAPSWVSWRYTSDYCGWAPLPPHCTYQSGFGLVYNSGSVSVSFGFGLGYNSYAFLPWGTFCSPRPYQHCLPASRAVHVYKNSTPHNNWAGGGNGRAHNRGFSPERVRSLSGTEVRQVNLSERSGRSRRAERIERDGSTLTVRRPQFASTSTDVATSSSPRPAATARPASRQTAARTAETTVSPGAQLPAPLTSTLSPATQTPRQDDRGGREQSVSARTDRRPIASTTVAPTIEQPPVSAPTRGENRADRNAESGAARIRRNAASVPTPVTPEPPAARPVANVIEPKSTETKTAEPRVIQPNRQAPSRPSAPAQRNSIVVIGNGNNNRSGGRDYSVWNTPSQSPTPAPARENASRNAQPVQDASRQAQPQQPSSASTALENSSALTARAQNGNWQNRGNSYNRPENRGNNQSYSLPQSGQVIGPSARSAPAANYHARPAQSAPAQNNTPRSQPATQPSAARVESRPAPAPGQSAPAQSRPSASTSSQASQNQGRPNR